MSTHYICTGGCKGVAAAPGVCTTENCAKEAQPLTQCDCTDHEHHGAFTAPTEDHDDVTIVNG